ncbi:MAG TPA: DMT family transporter [Gaiellales bacterium]|jgi:transporter family-2 protein
MDRNAALAMTVAASALVAAQAPINSQLGKAVGTFEAALVSFAVGTAALTVVVAVTGRFGDIMHVGNVRWYYLTGGLLGIVFVSTLLVAVRTLGASGILAGTLVGQMAASVAIDRFGLLGVQQATITATRLSGIALVAAGAWLVTRS